MSKQACLSPISTRKYPVWELMDNFDRLGSPVAFANRSETLARCRSCLSHLALSDLRIRITAKVVQEEMDCLVCWILFRGCVRSSFEDKNKQKMGGLVQHLCSAVSMGVRFGLTGSTFRLEKCPVYSTKFPPGFRFFMEGGLTT